MKYIKYLIEIFSRAAAAAAGKLIPIKKNRILLYSFTGTQYSCSPKYITEYLLKNCPDKYEIIWAFRKGISPLVPDGIKVVSYQSLRFFYYHLSAKVVISNIYPYHLIGIKRNQVMIDTWHGGGAYKVAGFDLCKNDFLEKRTLEFYRRNIHAFLSSSELFTRHFIRESMRFDGKVLPTGLPRNDIFYKEAEELAAIKERASKALNLKKGVKLLLYAPTWRERDDMEGFRLEVPRLKEALHRRFGGEWEIGVRMHMYSDTPVQGDVVDAKNYPDMQELLVAADVLVTDYSSSIWDYSLTGKPCFLYTYDLHKYKKSRSFYVDIEKWGFPLCEDFDALIAGIESFDEQEFEKNMAAHYQMLGGYDNGSACSQAAEYIRCVVTHASIGGE